MVKVTVSFLTRIQKGDTKQVANSRGKLIAFLFINDEWRIAMIVFYFVRYLKKYGVILLLVAGWELSPNEEQIVDEPAMVAHCHDMVTVNYGMAIGR